MNKFKVVGRYVEIRSGIIVLSDEQANRREHCLKKIDTGVYEVLSPFHMKCGETFSYNGGFPKAMAEIVFDPSSIDESEDQDESSDDEPMLSGSDDTGDQDYIDSSDESEDQDESSDMYDLMDRDKLKELLDERGITYGGNSGDERLKSLLREDDADSSDDGEGQE